MGMIANMGILLAGMNFEGKARKLLVKAFMHHKIVTATVNTSICVAQRLMTDYTTGRLLIVDDESEVVRIVSGTSVTVHRGLHVGIKAV